MNRKVCLTMLLIPHCPLAAAADPDLWPKLIQRIEDERAAPPRARRAARRPAASAQAATQRGPAETPTARGEDRSGWAVRDEPAATAAALQFFGLPAAEARQVSAQIVTVDEDNTPFLHGQIEKRPIWRVTLEDYRLHLKSDAPGEAGSRSQTFDILLDTRSGKLLKIISRWPEGIPEPLPEPRAVFAEQRMAEAGREKFHAFPDAPPALSFLQALEVVYTEGDSPLGAKQLVAHYVLRSSMGRKPRRVWSINLRGIPPFEASYPGVPIGARDHMRHIVDATTGEWLEACTSPQPEHQYTKSVSPIESTHGRGAASSPVH